MKSNGKRYIYDLYPNIENVKSINDKYNLQLDLKYLNRNNKINFNTPQRMTKNCLKNYLFFKFSSSSPNSINMYSINTTQNENNSKKRNMANLKKSIYRNINNEIIKKNPLSDYDFEYESFDNSKKNNINEDNNTNSLITKINIDKNEKQTLNNDFISIQENNLNIKNDDLFTKNKNIINHDQKVSIDCLYSKVISKLEPKILVYKSIDKTTFELQKESSYKRFKKFESMVDKLIKTKKH